jgi:hypothetical protein
VDTCSTPPRPRAQPGRLSCQLRLRLLVRPMLSTLVLAAAAAAAAAAATPPKTVIHVSPDGDDTHSGAADQPLATCAAAVKKVARLRAVAAAAGLAAGQGGGGGAGGATEVLFAPGTYPLTSATACGSISVAASEAAPLVLRGGAGAGEAVTFDGTQSLDTSTLKPVSDATVRALLNPVARDKILAMPIPNNTWSGGQLDWNGVPLTPSVWPNHGLGYVRHVNDVGAVWASGRTKGPRPHCHICVGGAKSTPAAPCGGNVTLSTQPTGDWEREMSAGPGFGNVRASGYMAFDWYHETHSVVKVVRTSNETSIQFSDSSRYGMLEALDKHGTAPGRFTVSGLLSEVDMPGEYWFNSATRMLYIYPLPANTSLQAAVTAKLAGAASPVPVLVTEAEEDLSGVRLGYQHGPGLLTMSKCSWVTLRDVVVTGSTGTAVTITGGHNNTVGGCTMQNGGGAVSVVGGYSHRVVGNDMFDVGSHISSTGNAGDNLQNLQPTNHLIENNHMTQVFLRGAWQVRLSQGDRFSHNLLHDASGQLMLPGGPLTMIDHNEVFNTGYVEGDGGVMYSGASLVAGYGMQYRENFVHHSLEVPGLHGRGGIYFDDHEGSISNCSGNVMYKAAGRSFLVNGGAANNITHNLCVNGGIGIYNQHADDMTRALPLYDNGTLKRGDKGDYIWKTEQALGVKNFTGIFSTPLANRWPTFKKLLAVNSSTQGWASAALSNFQDNVFLNNSGGNVCLLTGYHSTPTNPQEFCDMTLALRQHSGKLPRLIDQRGTLQAQWKDFPNAAALDFTSKKYGFDTDSMGLRCDEFRKALPVPSKYRTWVRQFFDGVPSAAGGSYSPAGEWHCTTGLTDLPVKSNVTLLAC